jgi:hypothetical protein
MSSPTKETAGTSTVSAEDMLSEFYHCEECKLSIKLVLPTSTYGDVKAVSVRDLAEKVAIAGCSKHDHDMKKLLMEKTYNQNSEIETPISDSTWEATWKAVVSQCLHQREAFIKHTGQPIEGKSGKTVEMIHHMFAHVNNAKFIPSTHRNTLIIGAESANTLGRCIEAAVFGAQNADDVLLRGNLVCGSMFKHIILMPCPQLIYDAKADFEQATKIIKATANRLAQLNTAEIIVLPIFRKCANANASQKFIDWFKEEAKTDSRFKGETDVDNQKLIHWLNATPLRADAIQYVDKNGNLTQEGAIKVVQYLNGLQYSWKYKKPVTADAPVENLNRHPQDFPARGRKSTRSGYKRYGERQSWPMDDRGPKESKPQPMKERNNLNHRGR